MSRCNISSGFWRLSGIISALENAGIKQGDTVSVYDIEFEFVM